MYVILLRIFVATALLGSKNVVLPGNNVLLVKIEGSVWYTIYHQLPVVKGV